MSVTLRAEAEHGESLAFESRQISVFVGVDFSGHS